MPDMKKRDMLKALGARTVFPKARTAGVMLHKQILPKLALRGKMGPQVGYSWGNDPGGQAQRYTYADKVLATETGSLIAYWPLWDASGAVATDIGPNKLHGAYTAVTLGQPGIGDVRSDGTPATAGSFDGATSFCDIYTAGLASAFNGAEGTLLIWAKVSAAGVWTDGEIRAAAYLRVNDNNRIYVQKAAGNNFFTCGYAAAATYKERTFSLSSVVPFCAAITWSKSADEVRVYLNGAQQSGTLSGLGTWAGSLAATSTVIGAYSTVPATVWSGTLAHCALWSTPLTPAKILSLATV